MIEILLIRENEVTLLRDMAIQTANDTFAAFNTKENMDAFLETSYNLEKLTKELTEQDTATYLAWEGDRPAGFLRLRKTDEVAHLLGTNTIELQRIYVLKEFLGFGVGRQLMEFALHYARERKVEWIWLGVWEHNTRAIDFYTRWGFSRFSEHVFPMGDDPQTDWLLKLKL